MAEIRIKSIDESELDTVLAEDIDFVGELKFTKPLMIKGRFKGEIKATGDLYIGENAFVDAKIEANVVSLKGRVKGNILANSRVELFSTSCVDGDISTPNLVMESGCRFNGICTMKSDNGEDEKDNEK
ncbi:MAG: cell shape determination protein CcmA [Spirochaetes bacterium]|nr:MAG: cell shape determination protein CcmA [Spirochaetota bacterium]